VMYVTVPYNEVLFSILYFFYLPIGGWFWNSLHMFVKCWHHLTLLVMCLCCHLLFSWIYTINFLFALRCNKRCDFPWYWF